MLHLLERELFMKRFRRIATQFGLLLFALLVSAWTSECAAAPLLLRGTATIATVYDDYEYEETVRRLPFAAQVGDSFQFYLSIESQLSDPDGPSGHAAFRSTIGGVQLEHNELEVAVRNDSGVALLTLAVPRIVDMMAIEGDAISIRRDYRRGTTDYAGMTNVPGGMDFQLDLGFLAYDLAGRRPYPAILHDVLIPQDASTWQAFSDREIALWFKNTTFVGAYVNDIVVVPEPSTLSIGGWCCLSWLGIRFAPRRSHLVPRA
ncbi:MAG: hypothetical protein C0485_00420 [Pirellula sp.]|nr:hypothetical protein [Pirellula sp.]